MKVLVGNAFSTSRSFIMVVLAETKTRKEKKGRRRQKGGEFIIILDHIFIPHGLGVLVGWDLYKH